MNSRITKIVAVCLALGVVGVGAKAPIQSTDLTRSKMRAALFDAYLWLTAMPWLGRLADRLLQSATRLVTSLVAVPCLARLSGSGSERCRLGLVALVCAARRADARPLSVTLPVRGLRRTVAVREWSDVQVLCDTIGAEAYDVSLAAEPRVILDLGAHIGVTAVWFASRWPGARVLAVEPDPANFALLERNVCGLARVHTLHAAVAATAGDRTLYAARAGWDSSLVVRSPGAQEVLVRCLTLEGLCGAFGVDRVDLLKLDIEGAELELLAGRTDLSRVHAMVGEFHGEAGDASSEDVERWFAAFDVRWRRTGPQHYHFVAVRLPERSR